MILFLPLGAALALNIAPVALELSSGAWLTLAYLLAVLQVLIGGIAVATSAILLSDRLVGKTTVATDAFRQIRPHLRALLAAGLAAGLAFIVLLQLAGLFAFFVLPLLYGPVIVSQVIVLERLDFRAATQRSGELLHKEKVRIFMYLFTMALGVTLLSFISALVVALLASATNAQVFSLLGTLMQIAAAAVLMPFIAAAGLVSYLDLRARKEGFEASEPRHEREAAG